MRGQSLDENARVRRVYERYAARYDRSVRFWERVLRIDEGRTWIASLTRGDVLEVGIGTGRNLPYYPANVRVTGIDLSPAMLEVARRRARGLRREVDLRVGSAESLGVGDSSFDTVVFTLSLCRSRTTEGLCPRPGACCGPAGGYSSSNTSAAPPCPSALANVSLSRCSCGSRPIICSATRSTTSRPSASR